MSKQKGFSNLDTDGKFKAVLADLDILFARIAALEKELREIRDLVLNSQPR